MRINSKMSKTQIIATIIAILFLIILIQNTEVVEFRFFFWQVAMSRIIMLGLALLIGFIIGYIVAHNKSRKKNKPF